MMANSSSNSSNIVPYDINISRNKNSSSSIIDMANILKIDNKNSMKISFQKEVDNMDFLEKYIEKMDRDQSDLRNDIRASEERTANLIKQLYEHNLKIEDKIDKTMDSVDEKIGKLEEKMTSTNNWITGVCIATILGIAAMVIAVILG